MMKEDEFKKILTNQYVIVDTNILIKAFENTSYFKGFFELIKDCDCNDIITSEFVNFEFTRNDYLPEMINLKKEFLAKINAFDLPHKDNLLKEALEIAKIYSCHGIQKGKISLVDCCIAALLKQYGSKLFLATLNHSDFPISLFDREYVFPIDAENDVLPVGFYRFNEEKWQKLKEKLEKIK